MDTEPIHDLTAAYALDALDAAERQVFEEHLAGCRRCQEEVAELSLAAGSLAYAVEPVSTRRRSSARGSSTPPAPSVRTSSRCGRAGRRRLPPLPRSPRAP